MLHADNISAGGYWFCGNYSKIGPFVNYTHPPGFEVAAQKVAYSLSMSASVALLVLLLFVKITGKCSRNYNLQSSEHVVSIAGLILLQGAAFFISAGDAEFTSSQLSTGACLTQGTLFQFATSGIVMEIGAMSHMAYATIVSSVALEELYAKKRARMFSIVYGTALVATVLPLAVQLGSQGRVVVFHPSPGRIMCWLNNCVGAFVCFTLLLFASVLVYSFVMTVKVVGVVRQTYARRRNGLQSTAAPAFGIRRLSFVSLVLVYVLLILCYAVVENIVPETSQTRIVFDVIVKLITCGDGFVVAAFFILPDSVFRTRCCCCCFTGTCARPQREERPTGPDVMHYRQSSAVSLITTSVHDDGSPGSRRSYGYVSDYDSDE